MQKIPFYKQIAASLGINLFVIAFILLFFKNLPPVVPLYFGKPIGEEQLARRFFLLLPPTISILVTLINTLIIKFVSEVFLKKILLVVIFVATALSTIAVFRITGLVGNFPW